MLARVVLAIVLVLVPGTTIACADVCDETALIDEAVLERPGDVVDLPIIRHVAVAPPLDQPHGSPALARVFRPPR